MAREDKGHFAQKHPAAQLNEKIAQAIRAEVLEGGLSCAVAFKIAGELSVMPGDVGQSADLIEVPIVKCQLGLFGYENPKRVIKPTGSVEPELEKAIREGLINGRISCAHIFSLASSLKLPKMVIASACETLRIKISSCQLGTF